MPELELKRVVGVQTSHGLVEYHYVIATPQCENAASIDPALPTILLLHPVYVGVLCWHQQFVDPNLRRFNIVAVDLLSHGQTIGSVPKGYNAKDAANDTARFMDAIQLPPSVLCGVDLGALIALEVALSFRDKVTGLFLVSPLAAAETEDASFGRLQVNKMWKEVFTNEADKEVLNDAIFGPQQLSVNNNVTKFVHVLTEFTLPQTYTNWGPAHFDDYDHMTIDFFLDRRNIDRTVLLALRGVPVELVHCQADVGYPPEYFNAFVAELEAAGVSAGVQRLPTAPRFGILTHSDEINPLIERFVLDKCCRGREVPSASASPAVSPFDVDIQRAGFTLSDSDSE